MKQSSFPHARRQSGVVLIVAMVMLVVIGLASVAIMRNTLSNDLVADNNRVQAQAMQAAQAALRYCEDLAKKQTPQTAAASPDQESWNTFSNWSSATQGAALSGQTAVQLPSTYVTSADTGATKRNTNRKLPQCMAQYRTLGSDQVVVITARGFSDNYVEDSSTHQTEAGSVIWLQSLVTFI